jgi:large subunit ribosomal protein L29
MQVQELRELDAEELSGRLKGARRELFELRFKLAVGQLDNPQQIKVVRREIARILTIVHERLLDEQVDEAYAAVTPVATLPVPEAPADEAPAAAEAQADTPDGVETPADVEDESETEIEDEADADADDAEEEEGEEEEEDAAGEDGEEPPAGEEKE